MEARPAHSSAFPVRDRALFQAAGLSPIDAGAARLNRLRTNSGCAGTAAGSLPAARATARKAQIQFCFIRGGTVEAFWIRAIRSAKVGKVGSAKGFRDCVSIVIRRLVMTSGDTWALF